MSGAYFDAVRNGLQGVLRLLIQLAFPISLFFGLLIAGFLVSLAIRGSSREFDWSGLKKAAGRILGYGGVGLLVVCLWSGLRQVQPSARQDLEWRESSEASDDPTPDAPPIYQYSPAAGLVVEKTYRKSISLPPDLVQRIGADAVEVLSPYLVDPTASNVLKLADSFKKIGQDVVFTREVTREDEEPTSFDSSKVSVSFHRLKEEAFDVDFTAEYSFSNQTDHASKARFLFSPPEGGGTVQELKVKVGNEDVSDVDEGGSYKWSGMLQPGEVRKATVHYKAVGGDTWAYSLGSNRRRVKSFDLEVKSDGPFQFPKGTIQPTSHTSTSAAWKLTDVVTSQRLSLKFPNNVSERESYLQALATLPATLIVFGLAVLALSLRTSSHVPSHRMAFALLLFAFGLGSTVVLANYTGPLVSTVMGPIIGALLASLSLGRVFWIAAIPVALVPVTSMSPRHTGLWIFLLALVALLLYWFGPKMLGIKTTDGEAST